MNKIFKCDCIEVLKTMKSESVDLIVTDPPYLINYKTNRRKNKHEFDTVIQNDDNEELIKLYIKELFRVLKNNTAGYVFCSWKTIEVFKREIEKYFTIKNVIIWKKNSWTAGDLEAQFGQSYECIFLFNKGRRKINGKRINDVWKFNRVAGNKQSHQNEKPIELIKQCILKHSDENEIVFDGFMSSGTTCVACKELNRQYIGVEIEEKYFKIAEKRLKESLLF